MKSFGLLVFLAIFSCVTTYAQTDDLPDTSFHEATVSGKVYLFDNQGIQIYQQAFDSIYDRNKLGYYKAAGDEGRFFIHPEKKWIMKYPAEIDSIFSFRDTKIHESAFSKIIMIELGLYQSHYYLMENGKIVLGREQFGVEKTKKTAVFKFWKPTKNVSDPNSIHNRVLPYLSDSLAIFKQEFSSISLIVSRFDDSPTEDLYIVKKNGKCGVISTLGFYVIEPKYEAIKSFVCRYPRVLFFEVKNKMWAILDAKGNQITEFAYKGFDHEFEIKENHFFNHLYVQGFYPTEKGKIGFIDEKGKLVIPPLYHRIETMSFRDLGFYPMYPKEFPELDSTNKTYPYDYYLIGVKGGFSTFYAPNGEKLSTYPTNGSTSFTEFNQNGYFLFSEYDEETYTLIGPNAKEIAKVEKNDKGVGGYLQIYNGNRNLFILTSAKDGIGYNDTIDYEVEVTLCDETGKSVYEGKFHDSYFLTDDEHGTRKTTPYLITGYNGKHGAIDLEKSGKEIVWAIPPSDVEELPNEQIDELLQGWKVFPEQGKVGIKNMDGEILVPAIHKKISKINHIYVIIDNDTKIAVYTNDLKPLTDFIFDSIIYVNQFAYATKDFMIVQQNGKWALWNAHKNVCITGFEYDKIESVPWGEIFIVKKEGKYGMILSSSKIFIPMKYAKIKAIYGQNQYYAECTDFTGKVVYLDYAGRECPWFVPSTNKVQEKTK